VRGDFGFFGEVGSFGGSNLGSVGQVSAGGDDRSGGSVWRVRVRARRVVRGRAGRVVRGHAGRVVRGRAGRVVRVRAVWSRVRCVRWVRSGVWSDVVVATFNMLGQVSGFGGCYFGGVGQMSRGGDDWSRVWVDASFVHGVGTQVDGIEGEIFISYMGCGWSRSSGSDWEIIRGDTVSGGIGDVVGAVHLAVRFHVAEGTNFVSSRILSSVMRLVGF
jgi:hypothetical protein